MKIYGLYGKSGTGKSHKVQVLANKLGVNSIIDDGILIVGQTHVAGVSAKCERISVDSIQSTDEISLAASRRQEGLHAISIKPSNVPKTYSGWYE